jgi:hypothetical protein
MAALSQDGWIRILSEFGPCAFFVFMFFVGLRIARHNQGLTTGQQKTQNIAYSVVWLSIFVFAFLSCLIYWKANFPSEHQIRGVIRNLQDPESIKTRDNIFLKVHYGANSDYDYEFRIIDPRPDDEYVTFLLVKPNDLESPKYRIPIREEFYQGVLNINYDRATGNMTLVHGNEHATLEKVVYAAETQGQKADVSLTIGALGATDPIIRENARNSLISIGPGVAEKLVSSFIASTNDRSKGSDGHKLIRFEILRTLNGMSGLGLGVFDRATACFLFQTQNDPVPEIAAQAQTLASKGVLGSSPCQLVSEPRTLQLKSIVDGESKTTLLEDRNLQPLDLASNVSSGVFLLDRNGVIFQVTSALQGPVLEKIAAARLQAHSGYVAASQKSVFVATDFKAGCNISKFSLSGKPEGERSLVAHYVPSSQTCGGIVAVGDAVYVLLPGSGEIRYWTDWNQANPKSLRVHLDGSDELTSLTFDQFGQRLLLSRGSGNIYAAKIDVNNNLSSLEKIVGNTKASGNSIAASKNYILIASGKKITALNRADNKIAASLPLPTFAAHGTIVGVTLDGGQNVWIADDRGGLRGPLKLKD